MFQIHELAILVQYEPSPLVRIGWSGTRFVEVAFFEKVLAQAHDQLVDGHLGKGYLQVAQLGRSDGSVPVDDVLQSSQASFHRVIN